MTVAVGTNQTLPLGIPLDESEALAVVNTMDAWVQSMLDDITTSYGTGTSLPEGAQVSTPPLIQMECTQDSPTRTAGVDNRGSNPSPRPCVLLNQWGCLTWRRRVPCRGTMLVEPCGMQIHLRVLASAVPQCLLVLASFRRNRSHHFKLVVTAVSVCLTTWRKAVALTLAPER